MENDLAHAIAHALHAGGVRVVTEVPGYGASDIYGAYCALSGAAPVHSFNEEVTYTVAHGASLVGARAAAIFKSHGLARAAVSLLNSLPAGVEAGLLALICHDPTAGHSENLWDPAALLRGIGVPYRCLEPGDGYAQVQQALAWSEAHGLPLALLIDSDTLHDPAAASAPPNPGATLSPAAAGRGAAFAPPARNAVLHALNPLLAGWRDAVLQAKLAGQPWRSLAPPPLPRIPDDLPPAWAEPVRRYAPLFAALRQVRGAVVAGDIGVSNLFALPPYDVIDMCTHFGGSIALALGAALAGCPDPWAVIGDYAFLAAGHAGLLEALLHGAPVKVLLLHNGLAQTTGGQPVPEALLEAALAPCADLRQRIADPSDAAECAAVLARAAAAPGLQIVQADYKDWA